MIIMQRGKSQQFVAQSFELGRSPPPLHHLDILQIWPHCKPFFTLVKNQPLLSTNTSHQTFKFQNRYVGIFLFVNDPIFSFSFRKKIHNTVLYYSGLWTQYSAVPCNIQPYHNSIIVYCTEREDFPPKKVFFRATCTSFSDVKNVVSRIWQKNTKYDYDGCNDNYDENFDDNDDKNDQINIQILRVLGKNLPILGNISW